jgi:hypothetical protein
VATREPVRAHHFRTPASGTLEGMDISAALGSLAPCLAAHASVQRGVFTGDQARAAGYTDSEIQRLRRPLPTPHSWWSIRRGVYVVKQWYDGLAALEQHQVQLSALALVVDEAAVPSHVSAAVELGLEMLDPDLSELHVTRAERKGSRREAGVHHHAAELPEGHLSRRDGQRTVTSAARTAVDLARECARLEQGVAVCDSALRDGVSREELTDVMIRCRSWPGARSASRAVAMADGRSANPGESWSRVILIANGHAPTDLQHVFHDDRGLAGITDYFWEEEMVVGEFDGKLKYAVAEGATPEQASRAIIEEKRREDRLRAMGLEFVRWGFGELYRPLLFIAKIAAARKRGAARPRWI